MKPTLPALCLWLAACGAAAAANPTVASTASEPASAPSAPLRATRAASAACATPGAASRPMRGHGVTSRVRRIPGESDPCANTTGVAPPLSR